METWPAVITRSKLRKAIEEDKVLTKLREKIQRSLPDGNNDMLKDLKELHKYMHCMHGPFAMDGGGHLQKEVGDTRNNAEQCVEDSALHAPGSV